MTDLEALCLRLNTQFLDAQNLAVPQSCQVEALRSALEQMNAFLNVSYTLEGLDGALASSLPAEAQAYLVYGAGGRVLDYVLQNLLGSFPERQADKEHIRLWCQHLHRQYDLYLDRLRLAGLQGAVSAPFSAWTWQEAADWEADR